MTRLDTLDDPMQVLHSLVRPGPVPSGVLASALRKQSMMDGVLRLAERNGLYHFVVQRAKEAGYDEERVHPQRWMEEQRRVGVIKRTISLINDISRNERIQCIIVKNCSTIPHVPRDIDIFVPSEHRTAVITALEQKGMKRAYSSIAETSLTGEFQKTDIYTRICYFGVDFLDSAFLQISATQKQTFGVEYLGLNDEADFLLSLVHALFGHRKVTMLDFLHIHHLMASADMAECRRYASERGWDSVLDIAIARLKSLDLESQNASTSVRFPYLFDRSFILKCTAGISGLNMSGRQKHLLTISLLQDGVVHRMENSQVLEIVNSFAPLRKLANTITTISKIQRGDIKSSDDGR